MKFDYLKAVTYKNLYGEIITYRVQNDERLKQVLNCISGRGWQLLKIENINVVIGE